MTQTQGRSLDRVKYWQYADNNSYRSTPERSPARRSLCSANWELETRATKTGHARPRARVKDLRDQLVQMALRKK